MRKVEESIQDCSVEEVHWLLTKTFRSWLAQSYSECDEVCDALEAEQQRLKVSLTLTLTLTLILTLTLTLTLTSGSRTPRSRSSARCAPTSATCGGACIGSTKSLFCPWLRAWPPVAWAPGGRSRRETSWRRCKSWVWLGWCCLPRWPCCSSVMAAARRARSRRLASSSEIERALETAPEATLPIASQIAAAAREAAPASTRPRASLQTAGS